jgi:integrase
VRWKVDGQVFQRGYRTRSEADHFRSTLLLAQRQGEFFDPATGEPKSWAAPGDIPCHVWVRRWVEEQWVDWQPRTRDSAVEALSRFVPLLVRPGAPNAGDLRLYLVKALRPDFGERDRGFELWMDRWCCNLAELTRAQLADADQALGLGLSGQPLAPTTTKRYRDTSKACIQRAVELEVLDRNPWPPAARGARNRKARRRQAAVDVRRLPDPVTMQRALDAIISHQPSSRMYHVMTSTLYYAGLRPSEVVMLRPRALELPDEGWGCISVVEADIAHDVPGEPKTGSRQVPIPPVLVQRLKAWIEASGLEVDSLLFRTRLGNRPTSSNWLRAWHRGLCAVGEQPLRLYDCRHAAATSWLAAGVPLWEVARRLGHSVEVLVSTYVAALSGDEAASNARIDKYYGL